MMSFVSLTLFLSECPSDIILFYAVHSMPFMLDVKTCLIVFLCPYADSL